MSTETEAFSLVAQLAALVGEFRAASAEAKDLVIAATAIAESAQATAKQNEIVFRTVLDLAKAQDERCREHRGLTEALGKRIERLERTAFPLD
jgi:hypothetical protein